MIDEAGTLPAHTLKQLFDICNKLALPIDIVEHTPTLAAAETQAVLPRNCFSSKNNYRSELMVSLFSGRESEISRFLVP